MRAFITLAALTTTLGTAGCPAPAPPPTYFAAQGQPGAASPAPNDPYGQPPDNSWQGAPDQASAQSGAPTPATPPQQPPESQVAPATSGSLTFAVVPPGFKQQAGWYSHESVENRGGIARTTRGLVSVLPPVSPRGNFTDALRDQVQRYLPNEIQPAMSSIIFRRYVGDGLVAQFVHGRGVETGHVGDSWFALYLIDCGTTWQPIVTAGTYEEAPKGAGFEMNIGFELPKAIDMVEPMLAAVRCDGARKQPIVAASDLSGHYYFGNGASMDYVHIYTGQTSTHFVSYGGEYDLRSDGRVTYTYSSASNQGAGTNFGGDGGKGTWRIDGDLLNIALDGRQVKSLRIAAVTTFPDAKVAVLIDGRNPTAPSLLGDSRDFYSTKKR